MCPANIVTPKRGFKKNEMSGFVGVWKRLSGKSVFQMRSQKNRGIGLYTTASRHHGPRVALGDCRVQVCWCGGDETARRLNLDGKGNNQHGGDGPTKRAAADAAGIGLLDVPTLDALTVQS